MDSARLPSFQEDIILEILPRLPVLSLMRLKCVCKTWCSTISHPKFNLAKERQQRAIVGGSGEQRCLFPIDQEAVAVEAPLPNPLKKNWSADLFVAGSCEGLLLIGCRTSLFLWNPLTKYGEKVLMLDDLDGDYGVRSGFCYDPSSKDYKAVFGLSSSSSYYCEYVIVATLKKKQWVEISFPFDIGSASSGPVVELRLHWKTTDTSNGHFGAAQKIVYFDPSSDEFKKLPVPHCREDYHFRFGSFGWMPLHDLIGGPKSLSKQAHSCDDIEGI